MARLHVGLVCQNSQLVLYALWDPHQLKADEFISDVVKGLQMVDKMSCCKSTDWS